jgi:rhamnose utilization protein RhaD (predicted bifunctional aldolase and dehydrogenase)
LLNNPEQKIKPSIETLLHALMPQKIVAHLHAIEVLSYLVTKDCELLLQDLLATSTEIYKVNSIFVGYYKPGPELAQAVHRKIQDNTNPNLVFLQNHGIVVGGESIEEINMLLEFIKKMFIPKQMPLIKNHIPRLQISESDEYVPFANNYVQALATNLDLYKRLHSDWVLYPDHAVFLGSKAFTYSSWADFKEKEKNNTDKPDLIFIENTGVFVEPNFSEVKSAQLLCYYDVISRVLPEALLNPLDERSVCSLLNWDAEKLRQRMH